MRRRVAALLPVLITAYTASYSEFPTCERSRRRWEVECLQAMYEARALPEATRGSEEQRLRESVCPDLSIAAFEACPPLIPLPNTTPAFNRWKAGWTARNHS